MNNILKLSILLSFIFSCSVDVAPVDPDVLRSLSSTYIVEKVELEYLDSGSKSILENVSTCTKNICDINLGSIYKNSRINFIIKNDSREYKLAGKLKAKIYKNTSSNIYSLNVNNCVGKILEPGKTCTVIIDYKYNAGSNSLEEFDNISFGILDDIFDDKELEYGKLFLNVTGHRKTKPILSVDTNSINFGILNYNEEVTKNVKVSNFGEVELLNTAYSFSNNSIKSFKIDSATCLNNECNFLVKFSIPQTIEYGNLSNNLTIKVKDENNISYSYSVSINGYRKTPPILHITPISDQLFENLNQTISFNVTNLGENILENFNYSLESSSNFIIEGSSTCINFKNLSMAQNDSCTINVTLNSALFSTLYSNKLLISSAIRNEQIKLNAYIKAAAVLDFNPQTELNFGSYTQGTFSSTATISLYYKNGERTASSIVTTIEDLENEFIISENTCSVISSLEQNGSCLIKIKFTPQPRASFSQITKNISVIYNDGFINKNLSINIKGTSLTPAFLVYDQNSYDFDKTFVGHSNENAGPINITVTNIGDTKAKDILVHHSAYKTSYPVTSTCSELESGATCNVSINFSPQTNGPLNSNFNLSAFNGVVVTNYGSKSLSGYGLSLPNISIAAYTGNNNYSTLLYGDTIDPDQSESKLFKLSFSASFETRIFDINDASNDAMYIYSNSNHQFYYPSSSFPGINEALPANSPRACLGSNDILGNEASLDTDCLMEVSFRPNLCNQSIGRIRLNYKIEDHNTHGSKTFEKYVDASLSGKGRPPLSFTNYYCSFSYNNKAGAFEVYNDTLLNFTSHSISGIDLTNMNSGQFSVNSTTCNDSLNTLGTCTFELKYTRVKKYIHNNTLTLSYNTAQTQNINVSGRTLGVINYSPSPSNYNFGEIVIGNSAERIINITNNGYAPFNFIESIFNNNTIFTVTDDTCSGTELLEGGTCSYKLMFSPELEQSYSDILKNKTNYGYTVTNNGAPVTYEGQNNYSINGTGVLEE